MLHCGQTVEDGLDFVSAGPLAQGGTVLVSCCLAASCVLGLEALKMLVKAQETLVEGKASDAKPETSRR